MEPENDWRHKGLCRNLSPQEADKVYFPGSGGKPTRAKKICGSCPVVKTCLRNAIESGLNGFWAGTTDDERSVMARMWHIKVVSVDTLIPETPRKLRIFRKIPDPVADTLDFLDSIKSPLDAA